MASRLLWIEKVGGWYMKKIIAGSVLAFIMCFCIGCSNQETALNGEANEKGGNDPQISLAENQETTEKIDTYVSAECSWAYDVTDPEVVMENTDYFAKIRVETKEKTKYFVKNTIMPNSTYNVEVLEVISPESATLPKNIKIAVGGGVVSMEEYVNTLDSATKQKTKTDKLSKKDMQKQILISNESYYELEQGNEYYVCIRDLTQDKDYKGYYGMPEGGYDVFVEKDGTYVNVLTRQTLVRQDTNNVL